MLRIRKASAGAGKTYNLTKRYLLLLLTERDGETGRVRLVGPEARGRHRAILAVTFTNKATDEMKRRIIHELAVLAGMEKGWNEKSDYLDEITELTGADEGAVAQRAAAALRDLLHDFGFFNVSTIDSFFQSVLRTFAREAELPGNYELDLDEDAAIRLGVNQMLQSINRNTGDGDAASLRRLEHWLTEMMTDQIRLGKGFNIFNRNTDVHNAVVSFIKGISDETYASRREEIDSWLEDERRPEALTRAIRDEIASIKERTRRAASLIDGNKGLKKNFAGYMAELAAEGHIERSLKTLAGLAERPETAFEKGYAPDGNELLAAQTAGSLYTEGQKKIPLYTEIIGQLYVLGLTGHVNRYVTEFRNETSTLLLSDTNAILSRIIGHDPTPFIYERTGQWINHFLIDEFQDTSRLQWHNMLPLIEESLGSGHDNLVIGDEKQCIYRFRNSDPTLLHNLADSFGERAQSDGSGIADMTNWRSAPEIVRFNNTFFRTLGLTAGGKLAEIYSDATQFPAKKNLDLPGRVLFHALKGKNNDEMREEAFEFTLNEIARQVSAGYSPGDIAVLFRKSGEGARFIEALLARVASDPAYPRLKVMSDESLYVSRSRAVRMVISVLRVLGATDYASTKRSLTSRERARLLNGFEYRLSRGDNETSALANAVAGFRSDALPDPTEGLDTTASASLVSIIEHIIERHVGKEQQEQENVYLTALVDLAVEQTSRGVTDIPAFLTWWDRKGQRSCVPAGLDPDAVRVMTIHKSKGLEFGCVHIPFNDSKDPLPGVKWFDASGLDFVDPELLPPLLPLRPTQKLEGTPFEAQYREMKEDDAVDEANVVYVAFTRAVRELTVCYTPQPTQYTPFSAFVADILGAASAPEMIERLRSEIPAEALEKGVGDVFADLSADPDGTVETGCPTAPREKRTKLTMLDPSETIVMPGGIRASDSRVWQSVRLDEESEPLESASSGLTVNGELVMMAMKRIDSAADIGRVSAGLVERGRLAPEKEADFRHLLELRVSGPATAQWFSGYAKVMRNRTVSFRPGSTGVADRIVWHKDGSIDVIQYAADESQTESAASAAGYMRRSMIYARMGNVRAYAWNLVSGIITECE